MFTRSSTVPFDGNSVILKANQVCIFSVNAELFRRLQRFSSEGLLKSGNHDNQGVTYMWGYNTLCLWMVLWEWK
jgi:hypothetical protein